MKKGKVYAADLTMAGLLLCGILMYLSRIQMGMAELDESFYLTIPYRLTQGDRLLADEWHVSQLAGFLTYPIMKIYLAIVGTTDGIVLAFRYIYLAAQIGVTVIGYLLMRRQWRWSVVFVSLVYFLFTPFGIKALSYNTMGLMAVYLFAVVDMTTIKPSIPRYVWMGFLLAAAVLCNPYMVLLYGVLVLIALGRWSVWKKLLWITVGAGGLFVLFMVFQLSRVGIGEMLAGIPFVMADDAHQAKGLRRVFNTFLYYVKEYPAYFWVWLICVPVGLLWRKAAPVMLLLLSLASGGLTLYFALHLTGGIGYAAITVALTCTGLAVFLFTETKNWKLLGGWLVGVFYAFCMSASSNNAIYTFANGCTVSACAALLMLAEYGAEVLGRRKEQSVQKTGKNEILISQEKVEKRDAGFGFSQWVIITVATLLFLTQLFAESYVLMRHIFWESSPEALTAQVEAGPLKGLRSTPGKVKRYMVNYENVLELRELDGENVIFYCRFPCGYLILDQWANAGMSAWLADSVEDLGDQKMDEYLSMHPEKLPDVIYVDTESTSVWTIQEWTQYCAEKGYRLERFEQGGYALIRQE